MNAPGPARRPTTSTLVVSADCRNCQWKTAGANGLGNAAQHHDATGHVVDAHIARHVVYGDPYAPADQQTDLLTALEELDQ
jgi:hypothetical protein